jgi:hypothetical protein
VELDSPRTESKARSNLSVRCSSGDEQRDLKLVRRQARGSRDLTQLHQYERIATGGSDQLLRNNGRQSEAATLEKRMCRIILQTLELEICNARCLEAFPLMLARGDEHQDALAMQTSADMKDGIGRRIVEPVGIIDQAEERTRSGGLYERCERGSVHRSTIRCAGCAARERSG